MHIINWKDDPYTTGEFQRKFLKGIDISKMGTQQGCKTLLKIAEIALDISTKDMCSLDKIEVVSKGLAQPELYLHQGKDKTTIRYFNAHRTNYPCIFSYGNSTTQDIARQVGRKVNCEYPEFGLESEIDLYPDLKRKI